MNTIRISARRWGGGVVDEVHLGLPAKPPFRLFLRLLHDRQERIEQIERHDDRCLQRGIGAL